MNATESVEALCAQLDVTPIWAAINQSPPPPLVMRLVTLAAELASALDFGTASPQHLAAALDSGAPEAVDGYVGLALDMAEIRDDAVDRARQLLGDLIEAGIVR